MLFGAFKQIFSRSEYAKEIRAAAVAKETGPRGGKMYLCANCGHAFVLGDVNVDHVEPVVMLQTTYGEMSLQSLIDRLWCDKRNLQVLCKKCHKEKSKREKKIRAALRRSKHGKE